MAITWGSAITSGSNGMRLGYEITMSPSSVSSGTSSVSLRLRLYVWTRRSVYDSTNSWAISGNWSGSGAANISHGSSSSWSTSNRTLIATRTITVSPSYTGTLTRSFSASLSGINAVPGTARVSGSFRVPRRPVTRPDDPRNLRVTRNSDGSQSLNWSNTNANSNSKPYDRIQIRRWDTANNTYRTIATVTPRTSYTDRTTTSNQRYRYTVRARNDAGYSGYAYSDYIATTPAAPSNIRATKNNAGDITVRWSLSGIRYHTGIEIWARADGQNQSTRIGYRGSGQTSWTHTSPDPSVTWAYRVRVLADNLNGTFSGWSPTVQLLTNPLAPTRLSPAGGARDGRYQIPLTWQHNEVDGTSQEKYQVRHRIQGDTDWETTAIISSTAGHHDLIGETYPNGYVLEWQVRTWGLYEDPSPWSNTARVTLSTPPEATIISPEDGGTVGWSSTGVEWAFFDEDGDQQTQWRAELVDSSGDVLEWQVRTWGLYEDPSPWSNTARFELSTPPEATIISPEDGGAVGWSSTGVEWAFFDEDGDRQTQWRAELLDSSGEVLETLSGAGEATTATFDQVLRDNAEYTIRVQLQDAPGLWSE